MTDTNASNAPSARPPNRAADGVTVYSANSSFFLWIVILAGFVAGPLARAFPKWDSALGWLYVGVLVYLLFTLISDFNLRKLLLWLGIFLLLFLASEYIEHWRHVAILAAVANYLSGLRPRLDPGSALVLSWILLFPWIGSIIKMILYRRKRFTPNEIAEFHFGEGSELTDRTGLRFRTRYRDLLETLLTFGGGDLEAVDNHQNVIKSYENILGLYFKWKKLDRVLHQRSAVIGDENADS